MKVKVVDNKGASTEWAEVFLSVTIPRFRTILIQNVNEITLKEIPKKRFKPFAGVLAEGQGEFHFYLDWQSGPVWQIDSIVLSPGMLRVEISM